MRRKFGTICMVLGAALLLGALSLFVHNRREADEAELAAINLLPQLVEEMEQNQSQQQESENLNIEPVGTALDPRAFKMDEIEIDGYGYIGYLSIPALELELPVMGDWDYARLKIAPCRYTGTIKGENLVIMAHNYDRHFGRLSKLSEGDSVLFTDVNGVVTQYEVVGFDMLAPTAVEEMPSGAYDLTLFTCTYGGQNRVTVYCDRTGK